MINYFSKYLGRGGWSSWAALPSSTQSVAANSGIMQELEPGTTGATTGVFCGAEQHKQAQSIHTENSDT